MTFKTLRGGLAQRVQWIDYEGIKKGFLINRP